MSGRLSFGADLSSAVPLRTNLGLAFTGMYPLGRGFVIQAENLPKAIGTDVGTEQMLKPFVIARDLTPVDRRARIIDCHPRTMEKTRAGFSCLFQRVLEHVKPERDHNPRPVRRENWWRFAVPNPSLRSAIDGSDRIVAIPRTAKWFSFQFVSIDTIPDTAVVAVASADPFVLGVLSSRVHRAWALTAGGRLGVGNDPRYQHKQEIRSIPVYERGLIELEQAAYRCRHCGCRDPKQQRERCAMSDDTRTGARSARGDRGEVPAELGLPLEERVRRGARAILQQALEAEVEQLLEEFAGVSLMHGRRAVVRNGHLPARAILTTVGPVEVQVPKVRDRSGAGVAFNAALAPPYVRRSARVAAARPWLYLKGISGGDLAEALEGCARAGLPRDRASALLVPHDGQRARCLAQVAARQGEGESAGDPDGTDPPAGYARLHALHQPLRGPRLQGDREAREGPRGPARLRRLPGPIPGCTCAPPTRSSRPSPPCAIAPAGPRTASPARPSSVWPSRWPRKRRRRGGASVVPRRSLNASAGHATKTGFRCPTTHRRPKRSNGRPPDNVRPHGHTPDLTITRDVSVDEVIRQMQVRHAKRQAAIDYAYEKQGRERSG